jgi:hypothetical protein
MDGLPGTFLWSWERPEDLSWISPQTMGVAYLAETIDLKRDGLRFRLRRQPLSVPEGTSMVAVVRLNIDPDSRQQLTASLAQDLAGRIARFSTYKNVKAVQVDFDARQAERAFYARLLHVLRQTLPASCGLSITALSSWCACDNWMSELPVDEIVPMLFSLGPEKQMILNWLQDGHKFSHRQCRQALGVSIDEPAVNKVIFPLMLNQATGDRMRVYIFSSKPWSKAGFDFIRGEMSNE